MAHKKLLSVAIIVQNQRDLIESTLTSLYELNQIPLELILIDDASTDGGEQVIESLLDYYQHEHTYYFRHERKAGRGPSLNEALHLSTGRLFWAPETIREINGERLSRSLERVSGSSAISLVQNFRIPDSVDKWLAGLESGECPPDGSFIWDLSGIPPEQLFFNPYMKHYHGLELASGFEAPSHQTVESGWYSAGSRYELPEPDPAVQQELLLALLRRKTPAPEEKKVIFEKIRSLLSVTEAHAAPLQDPDGQLKEAVKLKEDGRFKDALEIVEEVLSENPLDSAAKQLKVRILEKKRRFVEASELKHELNDGNRKRRSAKESPGKREQTPPAEIKTSIIIPTTAYGKPALENCLLSVDAHCSSDHLELIVIDNASLDDTHDYLDELKERRFMNCRIITNDRNRGFAASVNQGLKAAEGDYACILHNDVKLTGDAITQLRELMETHPGFAIAGPMTKKTLNPDQSPGHGKTPDGDLLEAEYLDSFCMMLKTGAGLRMDEQYELAFFEDIDLCFQARSNGQKVGIAPAVHVEHYFGTTTFALDLDTESEQYWKNVSYFNDKWGIEVYSKQEFKAYSTFDQLLLLNEIVNPLYPEKVIKELFQELFTDELKTEIFNSQHDPETLFKLVHLFMVMEEREVMRRLEDRLEDFELPAQLIYQLVRFYYKRNIYSRCKYYLDQLKPEMDSLRADLYRLAMHVDNRELDEAIPLLKRLLEKEPSNPMLYKLAGDIHQFEGNEEEAESFQLLAQQINPYHFNREEKDAFGFTRKA